MNAFCLVIGIFTALFSVGICYYTFRKNRSPRYYLYEMQENELQENLGRIKGNHFEIVVNGKTANFYKDIDNNEWHGEDEKKSLENNKIEFEGKTFVIESKIERKIENDVIPFFIIYMILFFASIFALSSGNDSEGNDITIIADESHVSQEATLGSEEIEGFQDNKELNNLDKYNLAIQYFDNKEYDTAKQLFEELDYYEDSRAYLEEIEREQLVQLTGNTYNVACDLLKNKEYQKALENFNLILGYKDSTEKAETCKRFILSHVLSGGIKNSFGITQDGKVLTAGDNSFNQCNVEHWANIVSIDGYGEYTIGLTKDGIVNVAGNLSESEQETISTWDHIIDVAAGDLYVVALKSDGTVAAAGHNGDGQCDVEGWENVVDIDAGWRFTVGLTKSGELLFAGVLSDSMEEDYLKTKDKWKDVVKIAASGGDPSRDDRGKGHVVGLTSDGHVVAIGDNSKGQCNVGGEGWENIIAVAAGDWYTVALTQDGRVLVTGENISGSKYIEQEKIDSWENIQDIAAGYGQILVVKSDGYVDAMGFDDDDKYTKAIAWTEKIRQ